MKGDTYVAQRPAGIYWLHVNPAYLIDDDDRAIVQLAAQWREGVLPEAGGQLDQAAVTVASIRIVLTAWAQLEEAKRRKKKG